MLIQKRSIEIYTHLCYGALCENTLCNLSIDHEIRVINYL